MSKTEVKRRDFLKMSATTALGALATACGARPSVPEVITEVIKETQIVETEKIVEVETEKIVEWAGAMRSVCMVVKSACSTLTRSGLSATTT